MGSERWLLVKSVKEADRLREYLAPLDGGLAFDGDGVWLDWKSKRKLEIGYPASAMSGEIACLVAREIVKRFGITRIGHDSGGWHKDETWQDDAAYMTGRYGKYSSWITWMSEYRREFSFYFKNFPRDYTLDDWNALETPVLEAFARLDDRSTP